MKYRMQIRLLLAFLVASTCFVLFSYSRLRDSDNPGNEEGGKGEQKCEEKKAQSEFILWESLSRNLLSINR
jgi:hypothetical protein